MKSTLEIERTTLEHWRQRAIRSERKCADLEVSVLGSTGRVAELEAEVEHNQRHKEALVEVLDDIAAMVGYIGADDSRDGDLLEDCIRAIVRRTEKAEARVAELEAEVERLRKGLRPRAANTEELLWFDAEARTEIDEWKARADAAEAKLERTTRDMQYLNDLLDGKEGGD